MRSKYVLGFWTSERLPGGHSQDGETKRRTPTLLEPTRRLTPTMNPKQILAQGSLTPGCQRRPCPSGFSRSEARCLRATLGVRGVQAERGGRYPAQTADAGSRFALNALDRVFRRRSRTNWRLRP